MVCCVCVWLGRPEPPFRTGLCFTRDDFFFRHEYSEVPRPIALKLCYMVGNLTEFYNPTPKILGAPPPPQKKMGARNMQNFGQFWTTSDFDLEYSGTRQHIQNRKDVRTREIPPAFNEKVRWTLVHKRLGITCEFKPTKMHLFGRLYFSP